MTRFARLRLSSSLAACALATAMAAGAFAARADTPDETTCVGGPNSVLDQEIVACTAVINARHGVNVDWAYFDRGNTYGRLGKFDLELQDYAEVIRLNPNYQGVYINRGWAYAHLGQYDRAIRDFDAEIRLQPAFEKTYYQRGLAYAHLGQYDRAIEDFEAALKLQPDDAAARSALDKARADKAAAAK